MQGGNAEMILMKVYVKSFFISKFRSYILKGGQKIFIIVKSELNSEVRFTFNSKIKWRHTLLIYFIKT